MTHVDSDQTAPLIKYSLRNIQFGFGLVLQLLFCLPHTYL